MSHSFAPPSGLPAISPTRGEIALSSRLSPIIGVTRKSAVMELPISPLVGEMAGRPEGGAIERCRQSNSAKAASCAFS
ncbi:hypothetical protein FJ964_17070 [Mesorhizobium sp. B2-3-2]|nr:hypothetical protein FJ964_17070 [Mesorhizobium sp. B2-3-2]